jgi:hypothetical protein
VTAIPETRADLDDRPSYRAAAIASALVFLLYLVTLSPSTAMWDTSEYIAAAFDFGLPHPPGNPFFVILGRFFALLPIAPNIAMRINILAALCSAAAAGMWFLITERVLAEDCRRLSRGADRSDCVYGLGAIRRQRESLHSISPRPRAGVVAHRALV